MSTTHILHDLAATLHDLAAILHDLAATLHDLAAVLHDPPSGMPVQRQQSVPSHTFTDAQALADGIHGMAVGVGGEDRKAVLTCPLLPHMLWGPK